MANVRDRRRFDWDNMPIFPRARGDSLEDRFQLVRLKQRRAKGPKNHATNKERSHEARAKNQRIAKVIQKKAEILTAYHAQVRAYWTGESDTIPARPL